MNIQPIEEEPTVPRLERQKSEREQWMSCCLRTDRQAVVYLGQMAFSGAMIALCAVMLVRADGDCSVSSPYISLLSFLAGKVLATVVSSA